MPTPKRGPRLGSNPGHQRLMMAGLAMELFRHGRITTTEAKARELRPYAEKLITKAKRGDLAARRQVLQKITDRDVVAHLFEDIGPRFADRPGGYTRMLKLGPRAGDAAPMALVELVVQSRVSGEEVIEEAKKERRRGIFGRRRRKEPPPEPAFAFDDDEHDHDHDEDVDLELDEDLEDEGTGPEPDAEDEHEDALEDPAETDPDLEAVELESKSPTEPTTG